jgi:hypothetical protein
MTNVKENLKELMEDLGGRIRNPLILSFILVWLYFHWQLVYLLFTMDMTLPMDSRLGSVKTYISQRNYWLGMLGKPLVWAFISLTCYYLIAIAAQAIKVLVGKRLNAFLLIKIDNGAYALKTELNELKRKNNNLIKEHDDAKNSLAGVVTENTDIKQQMNELRRDYNDLAKNYNAIKDNINNNEKFIEQMTETMVWLLSKVRGIKKQIGRSEILLNHFEVINGNWQGLINDSYLSKDAGSVLNINIQDEKVTDFSENKTGIIKGLSYDRKKELINYTLNLDSDKKDQRLALIRLNKNELFGLIDERVIYFKRQM